MEQTKMIVEASKTALENKKACDVVVKNVSEISSFTDYLIICSGTSRTHVNALCDEVHEHLKKIGILPDHIERDRTGSWILIDYESVIVHIFSEEARDFYNLERKEKNNEKV